MFAKIFNKKVLLTLLVLFVGLVMVSLGAGVYAESATSVAQSASQSTSTAQSAGCSKGQTWMFWGILIVVFGGMMVMNYFKKKKAVEENTKKMEMIQPGTTIKTIGLIEGEIVEVYEDSILIQSGNSTLKVDKRAIYQIIPPVEEVVEQVESSENALQEPFSEELTSEEKVEEEQDSQATEE